MTTRRVFLLSSSALAIAPALPFALPPPKPETFLIYADAGGNRSRNPKPGFVPVAEVDDAGHVWSWRDQGGNGRHIHSMRLVP
jgi:hypothetical protein